jgi:hypothetical protein
VRSAIMASGVVIPATSGAGAVSRLLGVDLPGPLDSAGITVPLDDDGVPGDPGRPTPRTSLHGAAQNPSIQTSHCFAGHSIRDVAGTHAFKTNSGASTLVNTITATAATSVKNKQLATIIVVPSITAGSEISL